MRSNEFEIDINNIRSRFNDLRKYIQLSQYTSDNADKLYGRDLEIYNKTKYLTYNSVIVSLYGIFESSFKLLVERYLDCLNKNIDSLKCKKDIFINSVESELKYIKDSSKYYDIGTNVSDLKEKICVSLIENKIYSINSKSILINLMNSKTEKIINFCTSILCIDNFLKKLHEQSYVVDYFSIKNNIPINDDYDNRIELSKNSLENCCTLIDEIVDQRNFIAHKGMVDNRIDLGIINEDYIPLFEMFLIGVSEVFMTEIASHYTKLINLEIVDSYNHSIVGFKIDSCNITPGELIFVNTGNHGCYLNRINSIELEKKKVDCTDKNGEYGVKFDSYVSKNSKYFVIR